MQYSQRDPNRDHTRGRIYRLVGKDKPLRQAGDAVRQVGRRRLLEQLREYEWRTRYRARRELRDRPAAEVLPAVKAWVAKLDPAETSRTSDRLRVRGAVGPAGAPRRRSGVAEAGAGVASRPRPGPRPSASLADERDRIPRRASTCSRRRPRTTTRGSGPRRSGP